MASEGIRVAKAYMDITTNIDEAMAETNRKVREAARDIERGAGTVGASIDQGVADGISRGRATEKASRDSGERAGTEYSKAAKRKIEDGGKDVESAAEKIAQRTEAQFAALKFIALFAGLPLAGAAAATATAGALAIVPLAFVAIAAAALKSDEDISASFGGLKDQVVGDTQSMALVLKGPLLDASDDVRASFTRMRPDIQAAMSSSAGSVRDLVGTVTDFAEGALPGMVVAIGASAQPIRGLRSLFGQAGTGASELFVNLSSGSESSGKALVTTGGIIRDFEGWLGAMLAELANGSVTVLPQFRAGLGQVEDLALSLAHNGMPVLTGATSGFIGTAGGAIGILTAVASGLGSWTAPLGSAAGSLYATSKMAGFFGTSLGETGFGLKSLATTTDAAGNKTSLFRTALAEADGPLNKAKAGASSLVSAGINPLGIALVGGGLLLDAFGKAQQAAAEKAAEHKEAVRELTKAQQQDNGVIGENTRATVTAALQTKNAAANVSVYGGSLGTAAAAALGNTGAMAALTAKSNDYIATLGKQNGLSPANIAGLQGINAQMLTNGGSYSDVASKVSGFTQSMAGQNTEAYRQVQALINGNGAIGDQVSKLRDADAQSRLFEGALSGLTGAQLAARDATRQNTAAIFDQQNASLGYRGAVSSTETAVKSYAETLKNSKSSDADKAASLLGVEQAFARQEQAAGAAAVANSKATTDAGKQADGARAQNAELVKLADTFKGRLPESMEASIQKMAVADARGSGLTATINGTGQAVYRLPNGKEIVIGTNAAEQTAAVNQLQQRIDLLHGKTVTVTTSFVDVTSPTSLTGRRQAFAEGGIIRNAGGNLLGATPMSASQATVVPPGTLRVIGDNMRSPEAFIPLDHSTRSMELLASANRLMPGAAGSSAASGGGSAGAVVKASERHAGGITNNFYITPLPGMDGRELAAQVAADVAWQMNV